MLPKITHVRHVGGYKLELSFADGLKGTLDWGPRLSRAKAGGIFEPLQRPEYFAQVELWEGTIRWPNGADVCPEVLHEEISAGSAEHSETQMAMAAIAEP